MSVNEPRRLIDAEATDLERRLLSSWTSEQPSERARRRVLGLVAAGATVTSAAAAGSGTVAKAVAASAPWALGKSILIGAVAGVLTVTASEVVPRLRDGRAEHAANHAPPARLVEASPRATSDRAPLPTETAIPSATSSSPGGAPKLAPPVVVAPSSAREVPTAAYPASISDPPPTRPRAKVAEQIASLDRARAALAGGNAARAIALVDEHEAAYPGGALAQEAMVLRIEALVKLGRRSEAQELGRAFIGAHSLSPHVATVRQIIEP
jgi:hypothetical protein